MTKYRRFLLRFFRSFRRRAKRPSLPQKNDRISLVSCVHNLREIAQCPSWGDISRARRGPSLSYATRWIAWGPRWVNYKVRRNALTPSRCPGPSSPRALSSTLPSIARGPNVPRASNTLGPAMNTPSVWLLYCEISSTLFVPSHSARSSLPVSLHHASSAFFLLPSLLLLHFLPRWISTNISSWHAQVVMCKKDEFYCNTKEGGEGSLTLLCVVICLLMEQIVHKWRERIYYLVTSARDLSAVDLVSYTLN